MLMSHFHATKRSSICSFKYEKLFFCKIFVAWGLNLMHLLRKKHLRLLRGPYHFLRCRFQPNDDILKTMVWIGSVYCAKNTSAIEGPQKRFYKSGFIWDKIQKLDQMSAFSEPKSRQKPKFYLFQIAAPVQIELSYVF